MGFFDSSVYMKIALAILPLSIILVIVGLATNNWVSYDTEVSTISVSTTFGLWKFCINTLGTNTCSTLEQPEDYIKATRAFVILAMLASIAGTVVIALSSLKAEIKELRILAVILPYIAGLCAIIGVGVFGGKFSSENIISEASVSWSLALTAVGGAISIVAGILATIDFSQFNQTESN